MYPMPPAPIIEDQDPLFLERLRLFLNRMMIELQVLTQREGKNCYQMRRRVAEWHARRLFGLEGDYEQDSPAPGDPTSPIPDNPALTSALRHISHALESLEIMTSTSATLTSTGEDHSHASPAVVLPRRQSC